LYRGRLATPFADSWGASRPARAARQPSLEGQRSKWCNPTMNPSTSITWRYLAPNPNSSYKHLFVKGTRIRARVLYGLSMSAEVPMTVDQIAAEFNLPVEAVKEAIAIVA
jgi:hypothetical protein